MEVVVGIIILVGAVWSHSSVESEWGEKKKSENSKYKPTK